MLQAIIWIGVVGATLGLLIGIANVFFAVQEDPLVEAVYDMLPHFNCGACGTPGCLANAKEIVFNNQPLESCKPGDQAMRNNIKRLMEDYKAGKIKLGDE